tara:strand:- start:454 stop:918 length:465 start_codon:yes stop_codon:yes gene_type:complete
MAKTYALETSAYTQSQFNLFSHSLLFADSCFPHAGAAQGDAPVVLVVTSNVESAGTGLTNFYRVLADDSQSETAIDISTGKFVNGNVIAGIAPLAEIQSDVRNFVTYVINGSTLLMYVGVCNSTQSQDYTPALVTNSRVNLMLTPSQLSTLKIA